MEIFCNNSLLVQGVSKKYSKILTLFSSTIDFRSLGFQNSVCVHKEVYRYTPCTHLLYITVHKEEGRYHCPTHGINSVF